MSIRSALSRLLSADGPEVVVECRQCGTTVGPETDACPECGQTDFCRYEF